MDVDAPAEFEIDAAMDFDMGGDFLLDDGFGPAFSESSAVAGSTRIFGKNKQVEYSVFMTFHSDQTVPSSCLTKVYMCRIRVLHATDPSQKISHLLLCPCPSHLAFLRALPLSLNNFLL